MQFVNITRRTVHTKYTGFIQPARTVSGNKDSAELVDMLRRIVKECGDKVALKLSDEETDLLAAVMNLDELGRNFDPSSIPEEVRNDPMGVKRASAEILAQQHKETREIQRRNIASAERESLINGEIEERHPEGLSTMQGEPVDPSMLKSGFDKIFEENARIAAGKAPDKDVGEILDPIGRHMKSDREENPAPHSDNEEAGGVQSKASFHSPDDATRTADAKEPEPVPQTLERAGEMDKQAAEMARTLSSLSVFNDPTKAAPKTDGKPASGKKGAKKGAKKAK